MAGRTLSSIPISALGLLLLAAPAPAQMPGPVGLDCFELAELEPLLAGGPPKRSHYLAVEQLFHEALSS